MSDTSTPDTSMREPSMRSIVEVYVEQIETLLRECTDIEDRYRTCGLQYHKTQLSARQSCEASEAKDRILELRNAFDISTPAHYEERFANLHSLITGLTELLVTAQHLPSSASDDEVTDMFLSKLEDPTNSMLAVMKAQREKISLLRDHVVYLEKINHDWHRYDDDLNRIVWYDAVPRGILTKLEVRAKKEEWSLFCDWLAALPETTRALANGQLMEHIATRLLWRVEEAFVPGDEDRLID
ncbi:hypothetical protein ACJQWK_07224 [Exserohilum turcicum]|uniref:Uncharacterized protein n=1 Tax=Exserohilum turcicum (strain 28A) TaxID=671987 RepID=R0K8W4_EXST2|nr:uncharacterized protein SETTUDRAFT_31945 [Exserohilum turcica Et28A]EOA84697.1 hypothetical protein SETTUDRAFT_31945 [Exserohilum turcica Et28A]